VNLAALHGRACDNRHAESCFRLAEFPFVGHEVEWAAEKAASESLCERGRRGREAPDRLHPAAAPVGAHQPGDAFTGREWDPKTGLYDYRVAMRSAHSNA
jgi:hypothetical protein